jgi:hypothetical protein
MVSDARYGASSAMCRRFSVEPKIDVCGIELSGAPPLPALRAMAAKPAMVLRAAALGLRAWVDRPERSALDLAASVVQAVERRLVRWPAWSVRVLRFVRVLERSRLVHSQV